MLYSEEKNMSNLPNRRPCITTDVGEGLAVTVSFHPVTNTPVEVFFYPVEVRKRLMDL